MEVRRRKQTSTSQHMKAEPVPVNPTVSNKAPWLLPLTTLAVLWILFKSDLITRGRRELPQSYGICSPTGYQNIYTVDERRTQVECLVVSGRYIRDTGSLSDMRRKWGDKSTIGPGRERSLPGAKDGLKFFFLRDKGHIIVPGLADAHAHILEYGYKRQLELDGSHSVDEILSRIKAYLAAHPDVEKDRSKWIEGMGWDQTKWEGSAFPHAIDLERDPTLKGRPIALRRVDGHALWISPRALELCGSLPETVEGGEIVRDDKGEPTGILVDKAMALVPLPEWDSNKMKEFFATTMREALSRGLTSIHDADTAPRVIKFFETMANQAMLPVSDYQAQSHFQISTQTQLRIYAMGHVESDTYWGNQIPRINHPSGRLVVRSVKLFTDGALGSWGAALLEPYSDKPSTRGIMQSSPELLQELIPKFMEDGLQVNIHCIGDRANKVVLDIFEKELQGRDAHVVRPRIEHAQIMTLEDVQRTGRIGVIPSVQPTHATSDMFYAESRLGSERIKGAYAYSSLLNASQTGVMPLGSDFPIEGVNPLLGFYAAVARFTPDGRSPNSMNSGGWYPEQRLTREQALKGMTFDAAYASFAEDTLGSLTPGKLADFVVLGRNIMTIPLEQILDTEILFTAIDGRPVYGEVDKLSEMR